MALSVGVKLYIRTVSREAHARKGGDASRYGDDDRAGWCYVWLVCIKSMLTNKLAGTSHAP